jgi:hypothetical protein
VKKKIASGAADRAASSGPNALTFTVAGVIILASFQAGAIFQTRTFFPG